MFKEKIGERMDMEDILLDYLINRHYSNKKLNEGITNHKILEIIYKKIIDGEFGHNIFCYDIICETTFQGVKHKGQICIYESSLKGIIRKHKLIKLKKKINAE